MNAAVVVRFVGSGLALSLSVACPGGDGVQIEPPVSEGDAGEGEAEDEDEDEGEGEGEAEEITPADNDTCASALLLTKGVEVRMPLFSATATLRNCSATNEGGTDGIDDVAFSFVLDDSASNGADVTIVATGEARDGDSSASPTLTLFDTPLCAFPADHTVDDRTCVGDGLTFDAPTIMTVTGLPAGTYFVVAETFGDLAPFTIRYDVD